MTKYLFPVYVLCQTVGNVYTAQEAGDGVRLREPDVRVCKGTRETSGNRNAQILYHMDKSSSTLLVHENIWL